MPLTHIAGRQILNNTIDDIEVDSKAAINRTKLALISSLNLKSVPSASDLLEISDINMSGISKCITISSLGIFLNSSIDGGSSSSIYTLNQIIDGGHS